MTLAHDLNIDAVIAGDARLTPAQALQLYRQASLHDLGRWSTAMCERIHDAAKPQAADTKAQAAGIRTYVIDRNINYTNVCSARCTFCAFRRDGDEDDAYILSKQALHDKVRELVAIGGTQILLQGGMHPDLPITFYEDMLRDLKAEFPQIHLHAFSPPEIVEFVAVFDMPGFRTPAPGVGRAGDLAPDVFRAKLEAVLRRLQAAGLDSVPGGGGEILAPHVRRRIGLGKATADQWLEVMAAAHRLGMFTSATMMFGHIEGVADRIDHMARIRDAQDLAIQHDWPGRYVSFISWPFQRENTPLGRLPDWEPSEPKEAEQESGRTGETEQFPGDVLADLAFTGRIDPDDKAACAAAAPQAGKVLRTAGASDYLRTQAVSRLFLDNIASIGSSWVTMGPHIGQLGLCFGANDMGSVMMEENVVSAAGTTYCLDEAVLCHLIRMAGYTPAQRDNRYRILKTHVGPDAPDRRVADWSEHRAKAKSAPEDSIQGEAEGLVPVTIQAGEMSQSA